MSHIGCPMRSSIKKKCITLKNSNSLLITIVFSNNKTFNALLSLSLILLPILGTASDTLTLNDTQTRQLLAEQARQNSVQRSRVGMGYPYFYYDPDEAPRSIDYGAISDQLRRLPVTPELPVYPPAVPYNLPHPGWHGVHQMYGSAGITIASVSQMMEQRLRAGHFGRLRLGGVEDSGPFITIRLVTPRGGLARVLSVDKQTGLWVIVR